MVLNSIFQIPNPKFQIPGVINLVVGFRRLAVIESRAKTLVEAGKLFDFDTAVRTNIDNSFSISIIRNDMSDLIC